MIATTKEEATVVSAQRREPNYQRANRATAAVDGELQNWTGWMVKTILNEVVEIAPKGAR